MLNTFPLFSDLSESDLRAIEQHAVARTYRRNTVVIDKGDETTSLYLILSGKVKVYLADEQGKEIVLNTQGPGEHFGELVTLGTPERTASVMTIEDSKFLVISQHAFRECLTRHPDMAFSIISTLVKRVKALTDNVGNLALLDVYGRVATTLADHATEQNGELVTEKLSQQDIANMVGASREMVSRILKELRTGGYIAVDGGQIQIRKKLPARW